MSGYGIRIEAPTPRPLSAYRDEARRVCDEANPPVTFRETLSVYRQLRCGMLVFRCKFINDYGGDSVRPDFRRRVAAHVRRQGHARCARPSAD